MMVGNNFVHNLWAICLLEADFNWINKVVFAKLMIRSALERNLIPGECFPMKGSNCINAIMAKIFATNQRSITMTLALLAMTLETAMIGLPTQLLLSHFKVSVFPNQQSTSSLKQLRP
jgi:hypothetical protein